VTTLADVIGHGSALRRLADAAADESLTHALMFSGPESAGKTTAALALATELLDADGWPGGVTAHPDLWLEDSDVENISIKRVRPGGEEGPTLQDFLALRPYAGGRRVAIIGRADRLTEPAANNILKSIEEPPPRTHLVLCAAHPEKLPATIVSRCEVFTLGPVDAGVIAAWLSERHGVDEATATMAASLAAGRPGRGLRLATEPGVLAAELASLDTFLAAGGGGAAAAIRAADAVAPGAGAEGRERALLTLDAWTSFVRDAACFAAGVPELALWASYRGALERWAQDLPAARIVAILHRLVAASEAVAAYAQPRLAFEALMLDIFGGPDSPPPVEPMPRAEAGPARAGAAPVSGGAGGSTRRRPRAAPRGRSKAGA
jgi:DNA polymerase III subunit delta'